MSKSHRAPWECVYPKEDEGECKPGKRPESDQAYFEIQCLCILQAGLNWAAIRQNWQKYRKGFDNFSVDRLARAEVCQFLKRTKVIRNKDKVEAMIENAQEFQRIKSAYGSFGAFLRSQGALTREELVRSLTGRFRHLGSYTAEYYLHAVGHRT